ncbi:SGNH/GDSL hydrolase family protein [Rhodococcus sp. NPDC079359]|uniref:SGNH/GDSL hydrolase family protein n=1 Tax=Rhodococcus sp. NPDC079359 TaxID=3154961 RepID=UPI00344C1FD4
MAKSRGGRSSSNRDYWNIGMIVVAVAALVFAGYAGVAALTRDGDSDYVSSYVAPSGSDSTNPIAQGPRFGPITATDGRDAPVVAVFGDSYSEGTGATDPAADGYTTLLAADTGWDLRVTSLSGGGYRNPGVDGSGPYVRKIEAADLAAMKPDLIVIQGGLNDSGFGEETRTGAQRAITAAQAASPGTPIVVVGLLWGQGNLTEEAQRPYDSIEQAARAAERVLFVPTEDLRFPLVADNVHPTTEGHRMIAERIEQGLSAAGLSV